MENISTALTNLWTIFDGAVGKITSNDVLMIMLVSSLVVVAFRIFRKAKKAAKA